MGGIKRSAVKGTAAAKRMGKAPTMGAITRITKKGKSKQVTGRVHTNKYAGDSKAAEIAQQRNTGERKKTAEIREKERQRLLDLEAERERQRFSRW
ncbi:MAG: hypothetical protein NUV57_04605 [archaeon]|nr:hypothetical protein [archaeon]